MKWFKHFTNSHRSPEISNILERTGLEGIGALTILTERLAEEMTAERAAELTLPIRAWARILGVTTAKFRKLLAIFGEVSAISFEISGENARLSMPKLLSCLDDYTRKSGHWPEKVPLDPDPDPDKDIEEPPPPPPPPSGGGGDLSVSGLVQDGPVEDSDTPEQPDTPAGRFVREWRDTNQRCKADFDAGKITTTAYSRSLALVCAKALGQPDGRGVERVSDVMRKTSPSAVRWATLDLVSDPKVTNGKAFAYLLHRAQHPQDKRKHKTVRAEHEDIPF